MNLIKRLRRAWGLELCHSGKIEKSIFSRMLHLANWRFQMWMSRWMSEQRILATSWGKEIFSGNKNPLAKASIRLATAFGVIVLSANTAFGALSATFNSAYEGEITANGYTASGALTLTLNFAPAPGQQLLLVNNTAASAISGTFTGLAEGATRTAAYGGNTFTFRISYVGGTGNDITLTRVAGAGQVTNSNTYLWSHLAGNTGGQGSLDATGSQASFNISRGTAVDSSGNVYVADQSNHTIRKVTQAGVVTTLAGKPGTLGSTDATGSAARFSSPSGVAVDSVGNVYVADRDNHTIRKVTPVGVVTTLAGIAGSSGSTDGTGSAARFNSLSYLAVDGAGDVYVTDNFAIRKVTSAGVVTTLAGTAGISGGVDGTGSAARFSYPAGVAVDGSGIVYVADSGNHTIRKVTPAGVVTTLAGTAGSSGSTNGTGSAARFSSPSGVAVDGSGNVYVAESSNHTIRKVTSAGVVSTLAGSAGSSGSTDGSGSAARFNYPFGVAVDGSGNVYVADSSNHTIRKVSSAGVVTTLAGTALSGVSNSADGAGSAAGFYRPDGVAVDSNGNVYVADYGNHTIRKVTPAGVVTTLAGKAGSSGSTDGTGSAARFSYPTGVAVDNTGNVYVADYGNNTIRKVTSSGVVTTLAGRAGYVGSSDGIGISALFRSPIHVALDSTGNVYVTDMGNHTIRKVTSSGVVTTLAGAPGSSGSADGTGSAARFSSPSGVAVDGLGNVYVTSYFTIRKVTSAGVVTTLAGNYGSSGSNDGPALNARFSSLVGLGVDSIGNVYVADSGNHTIRKINPSGEVTTLAGTAGVVGYNSSYGSARFNSPRGVAVSTGGRLVVTNANYDRLVLGELAGFQPILTRGNVSGLGVGGVTLSGTFNPNGFATTAYFEYGLTTTYGSSASVTLSPSNGTTAQNVSTTLTGLTPGTLFYYRLTASNIDGTTSTSGGTFKTISTNANLSSLTLSSGTLSPTFVSSTTNYAVSVGNATASITITPIIAQADATLAVRVNGGAYAVITSGSPGSAQVLNVGNNNIDVRVTAQDGVTQRTYSMEVTRLASVLNSAFIEDSDAAVTSAEFVATGTTLGTISLGFAPGPMQELLLVNNTGGGLISGNFSGLTEGATLTAMYDGNTFNFRISYVGGDGNDITLTRVGSMGQISDTNTYLWSHLAGSTGGRGSLDATARQASFNFPASAAVDSVGNVYVADYVNHTIRKVTSAGVVTTLAGSAGSSGSSDGNGSAARFNYPAGVAVDSSGIVYVADNGNHTIRKVTPAGVVTTLAGTAGNSGSTNGTGGAARFAGPSGVAVDSSGNVYVADYGNHTIRKVTPAGVVTTLAGTAGSSGSADGASSVARFNYPEDVSVDGLGTIYVADPSNYTIRKVTPSGVVTTLAGSAGLRGNSDGIGSAARLNSPRGLSVDSSGNIYVAEYLGHTIRKVTPTGVVSTVVGAAGSIGSTDGQGSAARFKYPSGVSADASGNLYVADAGNATIRKVTSTGVVTTLAGTADSSGSADGTGSTALFYINDGASVRPGGIGSDRSGNVYVADTANHTIRKVTPTGLVTTLAGTAGSLGSADGMTGTARFYRPSGVAVDGFGTIFVADYYNGAIRKMTASGDVTTLTREFLYPSGVAVDRAGNVYVADTPSHTIRKVTPTGVTITLAGAEGIRGSADGTGSAARFNYPTGVAVDGTGNVYVADGNNTIRKVTSTSVVTTLAGTAGNSGSIDGTGATARFLSPSHIALDKEGNVYVADSGNHTIRKVTPTGIVTTIGGLAGRIGHEFGIGSIARFNSPYGVAVSSNGRIYVTDANNRVTQAVQVGFQPILTHGSVSQLGISGAILSGTVNPNGFETTASFEYGLTSTYGSSASVTLSSSNGTTAQNVSAALTGLSPATLYYYRLTASNVDGTTSTSGGTFTTMSAMSTNADLGGLTLSSGTLSPTFASATTSYTASVANATASITVTPTLAQPDATISVRIKGGTYAPVTSGSSSGELPLAIGSNTIEVRVTAQDGVTYKIYTVTLTVSSSNNGGGLISSWRQQYFGSDQNSGNAADLAAPDGDGIPNLVKYALLMTPGQNGSTRLPQAEMTGTSGSRRLTLTFQRDPSRSDVSIVVEAQSGLDGAWSEIARSTNGADFTGSAAVSETSGADGAKSVTVQDVQANASRRFMRMRVER
jgi:sugar lactone lactonase YvrE